ncbi:TetR/AcrR family transcriptional regulator, partial [Acinetobacter oleivorans]|nr:TetR/AcrR family transcriptional regulator [Acinetobacter oleivorans]
YIDWINTDDFNGCLFKKATFEVLQLYPSIKDQVNEYREWIYKLVFSTFLELEIKDAHTLTNIFLNIIDGLIIDGTINKSQINSEQTWSYINKLINFEATQAYAAA